MASQVTPMQPSFAASLRAAADWLDAHPELGEPSRVTVSFGFWDDDAKRLLAAVARALPKADKAAYGGEYGDYYAVDGRIGHVEVHAAAFRDAVCERVVTTEEVTELVPDPSAEVPMVEVTKTVEHVEWVCNDSLLRPEQVPA